MATVHGSMLEMMREALAQQQDNQGVSGPTLDEAVSESAQMADESGKRQEPQDEDIAEMVQAYQQIAQAGMLRQAAGAVAEGLMQSPRPGERAMGAAMGRAAGMDQETLAKQMSLKANLLRLQQESVDLERKKVEAQWEPIKQTQLAQYRQAGTVSRLQSAATGQANQMLLGERLLGARQLRQHREEMEEPELRKAQADARWQEYRADFAQYQSLTQEERFKYWKDAQQATIDSRKANEEVSRARQRQIGRQIALINTKIQQAEKEGVTFDKKTRELLNNILGYLPSNSRGIAAQKQKAYDTITELETSLANNKFWDGEGYKNLIDGNKEHEKIKKSMMAQLNAMKDEVASMDSIMQTHIDFANSLIQSLNNSGVRSIRHGVGVKLPEEEPDLKPAHETSSPAGQIQKQQPAGRGKPSKPEKPKQNDTPIAGIGYDENAQQNPYWSPVPAYAIQAAREMARQEQGDDLMGDFDYDEDDPLGLDEDEE